MAVSRGCCAKQFVVPRGALILVFLGGWPVAGCGFKAGAPPAAWVVGELTSTSAEPGLAPSIRDAMARQARVSTGPSQVVDLVVTRLEHQLVGSQGGGVLRTELELVARKGTSCEVRAWGTRDTALPEQPDLARKAREAQVAKLVEEVTAQLSDRLMITGECVDVR